MARATIETLGFGVPSFGSQAAGSRVNQGAAWVTLTPRVRALMTLPPKAQAALRNPRMAGLRRMRGLGQDEIPVSNWDDWGSEPGWGSATGIPSGADYSTGLSPSTVNWGTDESAIARELPGGGSVSSTWMADLANLIKAGMQLQAQQKILDLNVARARSGLPPVDPRYFSPSAAVNFGLTPQATQMLVIGALGLGALLLLRRKK